MQTEGQTRYLYFLLTAAASGIALSISVTKSSHIEWSQVPLAFALLSWGASFYFGCRCVFLRNVYLGFNAMFIKWKGENRLSQEQHDSFKKEMEGTSGKATSHMNKQFALLVVGAILFVGWHILEMVLRAYQFSS